MNAPIRLGLFGLVLAVVFALAAKRFAPHRYDIIGRIVLDDTHEREDAEASPAVGPLEGRGPRG